MPLIPKYSPWHSHYIRAIKIKAQHNQCHCKLLIFQQDKNERDEARQKSIN